MVVDDEGVAVGQPLVAVRVAVRLGRLPSLVLVPVMLVVDVQMRV